MRKANYIIFDCETGGLEREKNPITQIALLALDCITLKEIGRLEFFIKPYDDLVIEKVALNVTGLRMADIKAGLDKKVAVAELSKFFKKCSPNNRPENRPIMIAHNEPFDIGFIESLFKRSNRDVWKFINSNRGDTQVLAKMAFPDADSLKLGKVAEKAGVKLKDAHKAMNDVVATAQVLKFFINRLRNTEVKANSNEPEEKKSRWKFQF